MLPTKHTVVSFKELPEGITNSSLEEKFLKKVFESALTKLNESTAGLKVQVTIEASSSPINLREAKLKNNPNASLNASLNSFTIGKCMATMER